MLHVQLENPNRSKEMESLLNDYCLKKNVMQVHPNSQANLIFTFSYQ